MHELIACGRFSRCCHSPNLQFQSVAHEHIPEDSPRIFGDTCSFGFKKKNPGTESHPLRFVLPISYGRSSHDDASMEEGTDSEAGEIDLAVDFMEPGQEVPPEDEPSPEDDPMQVDDEPLSLVEYQNIGDHLQPEPDEEYISEHTLVFDLDNHLFSRARQSPFFPELDQAAAGCVGAPEGVNLGFKIDKVGFNLRKAADRHAVAVSYWEKSVECFRANSCLPHSYNFDFSHGGGKNVFACAAVFTSNQALWSMPQETSLILGNILP